MKKTVFLALCMASVMAFSACTNDKNGQDKQQNIQQETSKYDGAQFDTIVIDSELDDEHLFDISDEKISDNPDNYTVGIVMTDKDKNEEVLCGLKIKVYHEWEFFAEDVEIIARHGDKLLINVFYGPGMCSSLIYSIEENKVSELEDNLIFNGYNNELNGSEDYIMAAYITYDVLSYPDIIWYDWDGNEIKRIKEAKHTFDEGKLYYITMEDDLKTFNISKADMDGNNAEKLCTIKSDMEEFNVYFGDENIVEYTWNDSGEKKTETMKLDDLHDVEMLKSE